MQLRLQFFLGQSVNNAFALPPAIKCHHEAGLLAIAFALQKLLGLNLPLF